MGFSRIVPLGFRMLLRNPERATLLQKRVLLGPYCETLVGVRPLGDNR